MLTKLTHRADDWGRRHPQLMTLVLLGAAVVATIAVLATGGKTVVLYQAF